MPRTSVMPWLCIHTAVILTSLLFMAGMAAADEGRKVYRDVSELPDTLKLDCSASNDLKQPRITVFHQPFQIPKYFSRDTRGDGVWEWREPFGLSDTDTTNLPIVTIWEWRDDDPDWSDWTPFRNEDPNWIEAKIWHRQDVGEYGQLSYEIALVRGSYQLRVTGARPIDVDSLIACFE